MNKLTSRLQGLQPVIIAVCLAMSGCLSPEAEQDYASDGTAGFVNQEVVSMPDAYSAQTGKAAIDSGASGIEIVRSGLRYDDACQCFVRSATFAFTTPRGKAFVRERLDSIWLQDSAGAYLDTFTPARADTIRHDRHVVKVNGAMDVDVQINTVMTWVRDSNGTRTGTMLNGAITGTFAGVPFKDGLIHGVYRSLIGGWGLPTAGTVHAKRGDFVLDLTFTGGGKADVVVTGKGGARRIHCDGGVETGKG